MSRDVLRDLFKVQSLNDYKFEFLQRIFLMFERFIKDILNITLYQILFYTHFLYFISLEIGIRLK